MTILITGATGELGRKVVASLLEKNSAESIAVSVRNPDKAAEFAEKGIEVRKADYEDPSSLEKAFEGIEHLLLISSQGDNDTRIRQHKNAVSAAKKAGVTHIVYTSVSKAENSSLFLADVHRETEKAIHESHIPYTFLRNNWYIENELQTFQSILADKTVPILTSAGNGRVGWLPRSDYAEAAAAVLTTDGHEDKIYELSGTPSTHEDLGRALSKVLGYPVQVQNVDDAAYKEALIAAGVPEAGAEVALSIQKSIREGALDIDRSDLQELIGHQGTPLKEAISALLKHE